MKNLLDAELVLFGEDETTQPRRKYLLRENMNENIPSILPFGGSDDALLDKLGIPFDNPKPLEVAKQLIQGFSKRDGIVIDFFAGSCTAAHAVLDLNKGEENNRKFIMVQFPEPVEIKGFKTIADIGRQRIRKSIELIQKNNGRKNNLDFGFKCYSLSHSNFNEWISFNGNDTTQLELSFKQAEIPLIAGCKPENLLVEILLLQGFPLDSRIHPIPEFKKNDVKEVSSDFCQHRLYVCLDPKVQPETVSAFHLRSEDILVCLDSALSDEAKIKLSDQCSLKVI
jgi:adenine-specific DNA-methyltransferase